MSRPPDEERPTISQWLIRSRDAAGFTNAGELLAAVRASEGSAPSYSSYAQWESGAVTPRAKSLVPIRSFHEKRSPAAQSKEPPTDPVVEALQAQNVALTNLAAELRAWRTEDRERIADLEATVARLAEGSASGAGSSGRAAPRAPLERAG